MEPSATVICDSISPQGRRLTTLEVVIHRFTLAEVNTHRAFSRNSASSRAIPLRRQLEKVQTAPAVPVSFPAEQPGMQGGAELEGIFLENAVDEWHAAAQSAIEHAARLGGLGVHKSICNRVLEPFMWHTVIISSTDWENYFRQRCSPLAQPELRTASEAMRDALAQSTPKRLEHGQWHMPYMHEEDLALCQLNAFDPREVSAARCARVSYLTHDGHRDITQDHLLYRRLVTADPPHMSPLEHVATPTEEFALSGGNFRGWTQLRTQVWGRTL